MGLHPATSGFEDAERYQRARPNYPPAAVDWLVADWGSPTAAPCSTSERARASAFTSTAPFALAAEHESAHAQTLDAHRFVDRVLSISFVATLDADTRR